MERRASSSVVWATVLILLGAVALAAQVAPGWETWLALDQTWPVLVIGIGLALLAVAWGTGTAGLAVPGCVVGGIGCLLLWQSYTGYWESWAYAWALIPGFVGLGMVLAGFLEADGAQHVRRGVRLTVVSVILFAVATSFFSLVGLVGPYWPLLLIAVGVLLLIWSAAGAWRTFTPSRSSETQEKPRVGLTPRGGGQTMGPPEGRAI